MARLTVEDCLQHVDNRYDLILLAAKRARQLISGATPLLEPESDKPTVIALREIADNLINQDNIEQVAKPEDEDLFSTEDFAIPQKR